MAARRLSSAGPILHISAQQIDAQLRELLPDGTPLFPTPIEAVEKVLRRLDDAWSEAIESPPIVRSARMVQVIESFARYTGVELAIETIQRRTGAAENWKEHLVSLGWTPPADQNQVLPGLPRPDTEAIDGAVVIDVDGKEKK
jgi:hypothetical protein